MIWGARLRSENARQYSTVNVHDKTFWTTMRSLERTH
jgi:hypothetical protein